MNKGLDKEKILKMLSEIGPGPKDPKDKFFEAGNKLVKPFKKLGVIYLQDESELHTKHDLFCNVPGCQQIFETIFQYESHYNALHKYLCSQCKKNIPSSHLLDLHISETHDSFFAAQALRKPMYSCFLEDCSHKSLNAEERKKHCIEEHKFPPNFRFETCSSANKKSHTNNKQNTETLSEMEIDNDFDNNKTDDDKAKLNKNVFFSFGHQRTKCFEKKPGQKMRSNEKTMEVPESPLENEEMITDLLEYLPD